MSEHTFHLVCQINKYPGGGYTGHASSAVLAIKTSTFVATATTTAVSFAFPIVNFAGLAAAVGAVIDSPVEATVAVDVEVAGCDCHDDANSRVSIAMLDATARYVTKYVRHTPRKIWRVHWELREWK